MIDTDELGERYLVGYVPAPGGPTTLTHTNISVFQIMRVI